MPCAESEPCPGGNSLWPPHGYLKEATSSQEAKEPRVSNPPVPSHEPDPEEPHGEPDLEQMLRRSCPTRTTPSCSRRCPPWASTSPGRPSPPPVTPPSARSPGVRSRRRSRWPSCGSTR